MQHVGAENGQAKGVAFSVGGKILDRLYGFVRAGSIAKRSPHAAGNIERKENVRDDARFFLMSQPSRTCQKQDDYRQQRRAEQVRNGDNAPKQTTARRTRVIEG